MKSKRPQKISFYAESCLQALTACLSASKISLGGAFGLAHYHEYRDTNDVDAWWAEDCTQAEGQAVLDSVRVALQRYGAVTERRHGDVVSLELLKDNRAVFSFQIARRSALLAEPIVSPWPPVCLDSFADLLAAKMTALVERGAPRDFLDVRELCLQKLSAPDLCWQLWERRERGRGVSAPDRRMAAEAVLLHLSRIERTRPLDTIADADENSRAKALRTWMKNEFCKPQLGLA